MAHSHPGSIPPPAEVPARRPHSDPAFPGPRASSPRATWAPRFPWSPGAQEVGHSGAGGRPSPPRRWSLEARAPGSRWPLPGLRARSGRDRGRTTSGCRVRGILREGHVPREPGVGLREWSPVLPYIPLRHREESPPTSGEEDSIVAKTGRATPARPMPHRTWCGIAVPPRLALPSRLPCPRGVTRRWCRG